MEVGAQRAASLPHIVSENMTYDLNGNVLKQHLRQRVPVKYFPTDEEAGDRLIEQEHGEEVEEVSLEKDWIERDTRKGSGASKRGQTRGGQEQGQGVGLEGEGGYSEARKGPQRRGKAYSHPEIFLRCFRGPTPPHPTPSVKTHVCNMCDKTYVYLESFKKHVALHRLEKAEGTPTSAAPQPRKTQGRRDSTTGPRHHRPHDHHRHGGEMAVGLRTGGGEEEEERGETGKRPRKRRGGGAAGRENRGVSRSLESMQSEGTRKEEEEEEKKGRRPPLGSEVMGTKRLRKGRRVGIPSNTQDLPYENRWGPKSAAGYSQEEGEWEGDGEVEVRQRSQPPPETNCEPSEVGAGDNNTCRPSRPLFQCVDCNLLFSHEPSLHRHYMEHAQGLL